MSWDSAGTNAAMQYVIIKLFDSSGSSIVTAGHVDGYASNKGSDYALIAGYSAYSVLTDFSGTAQINISRTGSDIEVTWDGTVVTSGTNSSYVAKVEIAFWHYAYSGAGGPSVFGTGSVDLVRVYGITVPTALDPDILVTDSVLPYGDLEVDFGSVDVGNAGSAVITIKNTGLDPLNVTNMELAGSNVSEFTLNENGGTSPCGTLAPILNFGESCTVEAGFHPTSSGSKSAALEITSNDPVEGTVSVSLTGTAPVATVGADLSVTITLRDALGWVEDADIDNERLYVYFTFRVTNLGSEEASGVEVAGRIVNDDYFFTRAKEPGYSDEYAVMRLISDFDCTSDFFISDTHDPRIVRLAYDRFSFNCGLGPIAPGESAEFDVEMEMLQFGPDIDISYHASTGSGKAYDPDDTAADDPGDFDVYDPDLTNNAAGGTNTVVRIQDGPASEGGSGGCGFTRITGTGGTGGFLYKHADKLRHFRDHYLKKTRPGRALTQWYYNASPVVSDFFLRNELTRAAGIVLLTPIVYAIVYPGPAAVLIMLVFLLAAWRRIIQGRAGRVSYPHHVFYELSK